ncbi:LADA_0C12508g1_1 [Lachancea dasiensis]|uniref:DNA polymerase epsilon subunit B n=1 Tax=Lachancea dasiensis TaxID=1072105 RepID=A0A1G4J222_9SACH|nr:LADA_0C12508g1_1 [Lachancea dasiensis]
MDSIVALPVKIPPGLLRPLAYRVLSKKYGLNIKSDGLAALAEYIGTRFGINWRKDSGTFQFLEQFAAIWDQQERGLFIDKAGVEEVIREVRERSRPVERSDTDLPKNLDRAKPIDNGNSEGAFKLKTLDTLLAHRGGASGEPDVLEAGTQTQSPIEEIEVDEDPQDGPGQPEEPIIDWQAHYKFVNAHSQQKFVYDITTRQYRLKVPKNDKTSMLPPETSNVSLYATRYHIVKDRTMRNEMFQGGGDAFQPLSSMTNLNDSMRNDSTQTMTITQIKNMLGRDGKSFLILGLLRTNAKGIWSLEDPSGSVEIDISQAIPTEGTFYVPGCIVLAEGIYYSASQKLYVASVVHPPGERRDVTMDAIGNLDLLGVHQLSNPYYISRLDKDLKIRLHLLEREMSDHRVVILGADIFLDRIHIMEALRKVLTKLETDPPLAIVFQGSFTSTPLFPVMNSKNISATTAYKNNFDALALLLSNFERLINESTFVFVPGPNDPWTSMVSLGTTGIWPQRPISSKFAQRVSRVCKKVIWASNPARIVYLSQELVLVRDDMNGRFKRHNILFPAVIDEEHEGEAEASFTQDSLMQEINDNYEGIDQLVKSQDQLSAGVREARKLVKTILDQGHLSPYASLVRPVVWDLDHTLHLSPIPTALILGDTTASQFEVTYNGCKAANTSTFVHKRSARYLEYIPSSRKVVQDEVYF